MATKGNNKNIPLERFDKIINLLGHLLVCQLYRSGLNQGAIARNLQMSKTSVNKLLRGINQDTLKRNR